MDKQLLLFDMNNMAYSYYYMFQSNHGELTQENMHEYIGFVIKEMIRIKKNTERADVIICGEGKHSLSWRRNIFPEYKMNRKQHQTTEMYQYIIDSIKKIEEGIQLYGVPYIEVEEFEADDIIYTLSKFLEKEYERIIVYSTDKDLIQICNSVSNVVIYNVLRQTFYEKDENIITMKAIVGDSSDGIPGLHRIGIKTFEKMMEDSSKWFDVMHTGDNKQQYEMFRKIIDLSQRGDEDIIIENYRKHQDKSDGKALETWLFENKQLDLMDTMHTDLMDVRG